MWVSRALWLVLGITALGLGASPARAVVVGVSDSDSNTFSTTDSTGKNLYDGLHAHTARINISWDLAQLPTNDPERANLQQWLANAAAHQQTPLVTFKPTDPKDPNQAAYTCFGCGANGSNVPIAPTVTQQSQAVSAFLATWGPGTAANVTNIGPWGEPDNTAVDIRMPADLSQQLGRVECSNTDADHCGPHAAAYWWRQVTSQCSTCTVVAGDFSSFADFRPSNPESMYNYVKSYQYYLGGRVPSVWGLHPYTDLARYEDYNDTVAPYTSQFANVLLAGSTYGSSHIWLTEVGANYRRACTKVVDNPPPGVPARSLCEPGTSYTFYDQWCPSCTNTIADDTYIFGDGSSQPTRNPPVHGQAATVDFLLNNVVNVAPSRITHIWYYTLQNNNSPAYASPPYNYPYGYYQHAYNDSNDQPKDDFGLIAPTLAPAGVGGGGHYYDTPGRARLAYGKITKENCPTC